jgi:hypothetical protein
MSTANQLDWTLKSPQSQPLIRPAFQKHRMTRLHLEMPFSNAAPKVVR